MEPRLDATTKALCRRLAAGFGADVLADCEQEAAVLLWRLESRLQSLSDPARAAYVRVSIRRLVLRTLLAERRHRAHTLSLEDLGTELEDVPDSGSYQDCRSSTTPAVTVDEGLSTLKPLDRTIVSLYYGSQRSDAEIASRLHLTPNAVKLRRHRALARLRDLIARGGRGR